jgi:hypothetical protein
MARAYSLDLRERAGGWGGRGGSVLPFGGQDVHGQRHRAVGSPAALKMGARRPYLVARERDWVLARIAEKPAITLRALLKELADRGLVVSYYALLHFLHHEGVTFKKSLRASEQDRPDVATRRERWGARQATIDPRRLVSSTRSGRKPYDAHPWPMRQRRIPRRPSALRQIADAHFPGGVALRPAHRALRHRRTDQWRKLPRLSRAGSPPDPRARRHCRHGQPRKS